MVKIYTTEEKLAALESYRLKFAKIEEMSLEEQIDMLINGIGLFGEIIEQDLILELREEEASSLLEK